LSINQGCDLLISGNWQALSQDEMQAEIASKSPITEVEDLQRNPTGANAGSSKKNNKKGKK
jgi:hypothetical protein